MLTLDFPRDHTSDHALFMAAATTLQLECKFACAVAQLGSQKKAGQPVVMTVAALSALGRFKQLTLGPSMLPWLWPAGGQLEEPFSSNPAPHFPEQLPGFSAVGPQAPGP